MSTALERASLSQILEQMRADLERRLAEKIAGRPDRFLIERAVFGGKRLRPLLLLTVFRAFNGREYQKALDVAVALELAHSASLVHDDILDNDRYRRGLPTLWAQIGMGKAILQGHRIINLAFDIALNISTEIARIFIDAWDKASKGILDEVLNKSSLTERLYMLIVREKTASLFEAAAYAGAVLAEAGQDEREHMKKYGQEVGTVYQLADDLAELYSSRSFGNTMYIFKEVRERVLQFLVASKTGNLGSLFRAIRPSLSREDFLRKKIIERLRSAVELAENPIIPDGLYKTVLKNLPMYFVRQMLEEASRQI